MMPNNGSGVKWSQGTAFSAAAQFAICAHQVDGQAL